MFQTTLVCIFKIFLVSIYRDDCLLPSPVCAPAQTFLCSLQVHKTELFSFPNLFSREPCHTESKFIIHYYNYKIIYSNCGRGKLIEELPHFFETDVSNSKHANNNRKCGLLVGKKKNRWIRISTKIEFQRISILGNKLEVNRTIWP